MITGETRYRTAGKKLIQRHRALKYVAACQVKRSFKIERCQHLAGEHDR